MLEEELQNLVLWEIPYPRTFTSVVVIYDRNLGFDRFYEWVFFLDLSTRPLREDDKMLMNYSSHKLHLFKRLFVLIPDGAMQDDDIAFCRVVHSRR